MGKTLRHFTEEDIHVANKHHEKQLNTISHQGSANEECTEIPPHPLVWLKLETDNQVLARMWSNWNSRGLTVENSLAFSYDPAASLLGICQKNMKTHVCTKICLQMFRATLFIAIKNGNNSNPCLPINFVVYLFKKEQNIFKNSMDEPHKVS